MCIFADNQQLEWNGQVTLQWEADVDVRAKKPPGGRGRRQMALRYAVSGSMQTSTSDQNHHKMTIVCIFVNSIIQ
jgi:hypothetical protein